MNTFIARVAPTYPGDDTYNTLVVSGVDLIIPLEVDLDDDPDADDVIRLRRDDGAYEAQLKSSDPEVEQDGEHPLLRYHFKGVPPGVYSVEVKIGAAWYTVIAGLRVTLESAFVGGQSFEGGIDASVLGMPVKEGDTDDTLAEDEDAALTEELEAEGEYDELTS